MQKIQENVHELIFRISKNGDERAFRMLFDLYFAKLIPFANYHINNTFQSEEIISDVFIKIWRQRSKLGSIKQFDLYLYTAVRNGCYNYLRDSSRKNRVWIIEESPVLIEPENPETILTSLELKSLLLETISNLPPKCRLIFRMVREDGMKYQEVADLLNISVKTVDVQVGRAVTRIRKVVEMFNRHQSGLKQAPNS